LTTRQPRPLPSHTGNSAAHARNKSDGGGAMGKDAKKKGGASAARAVEAAVAGGGGFAGYVTTSWF